MTRMNPTGRAGWPAAVVLAGLAASPGAAGQSPATLILPPPFTAARAAENYTGLPFSFDTSYRIQFVYWRPCFPGPNRPLLIEGITLRSRPGRACGEKRMIPLVVHLSSATAPFRNLSREFALNHGWNKVAAFHGRFTLPAQTAASAGTFNITIPFQMPFLYQSGDPGLVVELLVEAQPRGRYELDLATSTTADHTRFGSPTRCIPRSTGKPLDLRGYAPVQAGGKLRLELTNGPPSQGSRSWPLIAFLGFSRQGSWLGIPLPVDLARFGAPGCLVLTEPLLALPGETDRQGRARISFALPDLYELVGESLYTQMLMVDPFSNQLGLVLTNGVRSRVTGPYPVARLFAGNQAAEKGSLQVGAAPVVRLALR